jgi:hypothetical protein
LADLNLVLLEHQQGLSYRHQDKELLDLLLIRFEGFLDRQKPQQEQEERPRKIPDQGSNQLQQLAQQDHLLG